MATISFKGLDAYQRQIAALGNPKTVESMCKYSIYDAAGMVADELKKATPFDTGDLRDSIALEAMVTRDGVTYTKIDFAGYDRKGVPNMIKARVIESGTSRVKKKPFVRPTIKRVTKTAEFMMDKAINEYLSKFMKKEK
jgi:HK97 gp10 family phage protein